MSRPSASLLPGEPAQLYGQALRLTEELRARLREGDDAGAEAFSRQREALLERIASLGPEPGGNQRHPEARRKSAATIERILELDREVLTLLEARKAHLGRELHELGRGRRTLAAYRGPTPLTPAYVDRVG